MCGIFGAIALPGHYGAADKHLNHLLETSKLRGRDGTGYEMFEWGFIGASRARPLPEGTTFTYPHKFNDMSIVFNGTLSNADEIACEEEIAMTVDTQVIGPMVMKYGSIGAAERFVGGFAIIIGEEDKGLTIIRNFKTLYYVRLEDCILIASEKEFLEPLGGGLMSGQEPLSFPRNHVVKIGPDGNIRSRPFKPSIWGGCELDENKAIIVASGGIDSATAAAIAKNMHGKQVLMLNFDYGQRSAAREWQAVKDVAKALDVEAEHIKVDFTQVYSGSPLTDRSMELPLGKKSVESTLCWVPARNFSMLSIAASMAEARGYKWLYFGNNMEEEATGYSDNDLEFVVRMNAVLEYGTLRSVKIKRALARLMKIEIIALGTMLGVPFDKTWSCDEGFEQPCGICGCCTTRRHAFVEAGIPDEQEYLHPLKDEYFSGNPVKPTFSLATLSSLVGD